MIGGITWFGSQYASQKSDDQVLQEAMNDLANQQEVAAAEAANLAAKVLTAPAECQGVTTKFVFDYVGLEPDDFVSWPNWTDTASATDQACILAAFHQTNAHAFAIQGQDYVKSDPPNLSVARFVEDLSSAALWTDDVEYDDPNASAFALISGYYVDRAESATKPAQDY